MAKLLLPVFKWIQTADPRNHRWIQNRRYFQLRQDWPVLLSSSRQNPQHQRHFQQGWQECKGQTNSGVCVQCNRRKANWMTSEIFYTWSCEINSTLKIKIRHIVMFLDNASSHSHELRLSHVPPSQHNIRTSTLDQGIIRAFKARYRRLMINFLLSKIEQTESASKFCKWWKW